MLLWTNYFELIGYGDLILYRYSVVVAPDRNDKKPSGRRLKRIIQILIEDHLDQASSDIATDYKLIILSKEALSLREQYDIMYRDEEEDTSPTNPTTHRVRLIQTAVLSASQLVDYVTSTHSAALLNSKEELIQALNIVLGHHAKKTSSITSVGANQHFETSHTNEHFDLGSGLQAIRGFFTSVRAATARMLVNVQVKNAAFYNEGPLEDMIRLFSQENGRSKTKLENFLRMLSLNITHIVRKNRHDRVIPRIKQVSALARPGDGSQQARPPIVPQYGAGPREVKFFLVEREQRPQQGKGEDGKTDKGARGASTPGKYISVYDFFKQAYSIVIKNPTLPVISVGSRQNPSYLPAQSLKFSTTTNLPYWTYLAISLRGGSAPWESEALLPGQIGEFAQKLNEVGVQTTACTPGVLLTLEVSTSDSQIDGAIHRFMHSPHRPPPKFLLVILPMKDSRIYNRIKYACDVKEGLLNVCVVAAMFMKPRNDQYFANVALKVNLKLGGNNHTLDIAKLGVVSQGQTMLVGLDVTHPSPESAKTAPSVAGIVASVDRWLGQWPAELHILPACQEMILGLAELVKTRLQLWERQNKRLPENILIYRDGVSEGQYNLVLEKEFPSFRKACAELYTAVQTKKGIPRITIIVVGKRHNTRFYPTKPEDADRASNPANGTVVDRGVTEARNWDFFLQAHTALQGTARPAHYFVILDEIFCGKPVRGSLTNSADALEDLIHNLCYFLVGRQRPSVFAPPAYYADLLCERARCYLSKLFDP